MQNTIPAGGAATNLSVIDRLVERAGAAIYEMVTPLAITRWLTAEPVAFAQR